MAIALVLVALTLIYPNLPSLDILTDYRPKIPLRVYTADGYLIGEFGEERRSFLRIQDTPEILKQAILAAEDERFYQHGGIDALGVLRAAASNIIGGGKKQGASTITQQVAKNFFLSSEKTYARKLYEALLSFKIESNLSKDQIFELYINQIYLGQRAYGFGAAAQIYFGKPVKESASPKQQCWPACRRRLRPSTRWSTRSGPACASNMYCAACMNSVSSTALSTRKRSNKP